MRSYKLQAVERNIISDHRQQMIQAVQGVKDPKKNMLVSFKDKAAKNLQP
jgi:hypothetical protein